MLDGLSAFRWCRRAPPPMPRAAAARRRRAGRTGGAEDPVARHHPQVRRRRRRARPAGAGARCATPPRRCWSGCASAPDARIDGFTVQPMVERPDAFELIVGAAEDPQFGPVILFGQGGTAAEVIDDTALALPPLNMHLAREVMTRTRRVRPAAGLPRPAAGGHRRHRADADQGLAADHRLRARSSSSTSTRCSPTSTGCWRSMPVCASAPTDRPAGASGWPSGPIRRSSRKCCRCRTAAPSCCGRSGRRTSRPSSGLFDKLSPEDIRMRFFAPKKALTHPFAARLTQIDYDREMALVLAEPGTPGRGEVFGAVHIAADPDGERAEFAILLRSDMAGLGLGPLLMRRIIDYARSRACGRSSARSCARTGRCCGSATCFASSESRRSTTRRYCRPPEAVGRSAAQGERRRCQHPKS